MRSNFREPGTEGRSWPAIKTQSLPILKKKKKSDSHSELHHFLVNPVLVRAEQETVSQAARVLQISALPGV